MQAIRLSSEAAIVQAATELLARDRAATMSEIALKAGVGRATLHRHFSSRDELVAAIQKRSMRETNAAVLASDDVSAAAVERLRRMFSAVIPLGDHYAFLRREPVPDAKVEQYYQAELAWVADLVSQLRAERALSDAVSDSWAVAQIDQLVWTAWSEVSAGRLAPADAADLALNTFLNGLGVNHAE